MSGSVGMLPPVNHGRHHPPSSSEHKVVRRSGGAVARSQSGPSVNRSSSRVQLVSVDPQGRKPVADGYCGHDPSLFAPNAMNIGEPAARSDASREDMVLHLPRRRYTFDLSSSLDDEDSPQLLHVPEFARRGSFRRLVIDVPEPHSAMPPAEESKQEDKSTQLISLVHGLSASVCQASVRMNDLLSAIRRRLHDDSSFLENVPNFERFLDVGFVAATANYHLAKWIHQLDQSSPKPRKPAKISPRSEPAPESLLAMVQSAISRMELLSSTLTQLLQEVIADARPRAVQRRAAEPISPTFGNPARVAMKRGLLDIDELRRLPSHLEHLLWATGNLANSPAQRSLKQTGVLVQAAVKFRRGIVRKSPERRHTAEGVVCTP